MKTYLEFHDEKSSKFWEVTVEAETITTRWGRLGSEGQSKAKSFESNEVATEEANKLAAQKIRKGYVGSQTENDELQASNPVMPPTTREEYTDFTLLRDRWVEKSFSSIRDDQFEEKFDRLLESTLMASKELAPQIRAEIIKNMFRFHDKHFEYSSRYLQSRINKLQKKLTQTVVDVLSPGFEGIEVTVDLLCHAPSLGVLDAMLHAGINPNSRFQSGIDHFTDFDAKPDMFKKLVDVGANLDLLVDGKIRTALLDYKYLKQINEKGVDLNIIDDKGCTPMFYCGYADGASKSIKLLKQAGCNIDHANKDGETALSQVIKDSFPLAKCKNLINAGACVHCPPNPVPLITLIREDEEQWLNTELLETVDYLIKKKVSVDERDPKSGNTALHYWAGSNGKIARKICEKLLANGADINALNNAGQTPLQYAAYCHAEKSWKLLLSKKADINFRSSNGYSVAEWAVARGVEPSHSFLELLLKSKPPLDTSESITDISLLGFLLASGRFQSVARIIENGAVIDDCVLESVVHCAGGNLDQGLASIAQFLQVSGLASSRVLKSVHSGKIEQMLTGDTAKAIAQSPLEKLLLTGWPPFYRKRKKVVVLNCDFADLNPEIRFVGEEYTEFLHASRTDYEVSRHRRSYAKTEGNKEWDKAIIEKLKNLKKGKKLSFVEYIKVSDELLSQLWNQDVSLRSEIMPVLAGSQFGEKPIGDPEYRYMIARCGTEIIPGLLNIAKKRPDPVCRALAPVADVRVAPLMASRMQGSRTARLAKKWLMRHIDHAIQGLLPIATGEIGRERDQCEAALRFIASQGMREKILGFVECHSKNIVESIEEILSVDSCIDYHDRSQPTIPAALFDADLRLPILAATGAPLDSEALRPLIGMMSLSTFDDIYPDLVSVISLLETESAAVFAWDVFMIWENLEVDWGDTKTKKASEWMFHCLAYLGGDGNVAKLVPYIKSWPREGGMARAVTGLDILASIGTDSAIRATNAILLKTKYKPLLERGDEIMDNIADLRGLSKAQLEDRLVPTFGLEDPQAFILNFGARQFSVVINEKLVPALVDSDNKTIKALPKPVKADDKDMAKLATEFWRNLKVDLKTEASTQLLRYEQAMLEGRQWSVADFRSLLVAHPVLCSLVRHLVWGEVKEGKIDQLFMVNADGDCIDVKGQTVTLSDNSMICTPHPLQIQGALDAWKHTLVKIKLKQPFAQIARQTYQKKEDKNKDLFGVNGAKARAKAFRGLKAKGWVAEIEVAGTIWGYEKRFKSGVARIDFNGIVTMRDVGMDEDLTLDVSISGKPTLIEYSETVREIKDLLH